ncbi:3TM-type holin [Ferrovibrio sp.]|uniref:3TM-type holin n=1 Tax=Ferrovibrio sp. TaxID=1917215 RepID=UPI003D126E65
MGLLTKLFGSADAGAAIAAPVEAVGNALDKLFTSDDERAAANIVMEKLRQQPGALQVELNKMETASGSLFIGGWRPAIGWVCAISLAFFYWPQFSLAAVMWVRLCWELRQLEPYPVTEISGLMELVIAMLGLAGLRTFEKFGNKAK